MKDDEAALLREMKANMALPLGERPFPRDIGQRLGIPPKRLWYICEKWASKRFYEYGVSCDLGWLVEEEK